MANPAKRIIGGLAVFGVVAGGGAVYDSLTGAKRGDDGAIIEAGTLDREDLLVGDCSTTTEEGELTKVPVVPCSESHEAEVYSLTSLPQGDDADYPGDDATFQQAALLCIDDFEDFIGLAYEDSVLDAFIISPSKGAWDSGDRAVTCSAYDPAGDVTGSLAGAGR